jgi:hypothetical protein
MAFYTLAFGPHGILHSGILSAWLLHSGILSLWHFTLRHFVFMAFYTQAFCLHGILHSGILSHKNFFPRHVFTKKNMLTNHFCQHCIFLTRHFDKPSLRIWVKQTFYQFGMIGSNNEHFTQRT